MKFFRALSALATAAALSLGISGAASAASVYVDPLESFHIGAGEVVKVNYDGYESVTYKFERAGGLLSHGSGTVSLTDKNPDLLGGIVGLKDKWTVNILKKTDEIKISFGETFKGWLTFAGIPLIGGHTNISVSDYALAPVVEAPAPVPLPAAGFLLVAALGGLGMMKRRAKGANLAA